MENEIKPLSNRKEEIRMYIKRYLLKPGTTKEDLVAAGAKEGGNWINKSAVLFISRSINRGNLECDVQIGFPSDLSEWNDYDYVEVIDEDFGQPYTPFYDYLEEPWKLDGCKPFPALKDCIEQYNRIMDGMPFLIENEAENETSERLICTAEEAYNFGYKLGEQYGKSDLIEKLSDSVIEIKQKIHSDFNDFEH